MLNRIFYISPNFTQQDFNIPGEENVYPAVLINPADTVKLLTVYRLFDSNANKSIALALDFQEEPGRDALLLLASFAFLPAMMRIDGKPVYCLSGSSNEAISNIEIQLRKILSGQGVEDVRIFKPQTNFAGSPLFESHDELWEHYQQLLASEGRCDGNLFIRVTDIITISNSIDELRSLEKEFEEKSPDLVARIRQFQKLEQDLKLSHALVEALERELKNQKEYNELLRSNHSTRELQEYYNREYEVLPTWFKRLGHIVKVLTGKRSFRSLYRDDVKKYKD